MSLTAVVREIVEATGYPANDLLDGIKIQPRGEGINGWAGSIHFTRADTNEHGTWPIQHIERLAYERPAFVCGYDLPEGLWERLELACLADDPSLKGRKLVGGVELRNFHAYFLPSGEDQQWISNDTFSF